MIFFRKNRTHKITRGGYTIVELVVAVALFTVVVLVSSSAFLGVVVSNRKTLAARTAIDNLNSAIESMTRIIKTGTAYHCGTSGVLSDPQDCPSGDSYLELEKQKGDPTVLSDQIIYRIGPVGTCGAGQICFSDDGGSVFVALTAPFPQLSLDKLQFQVYGSVPEPLITSKQPLVVIIIKGTAGTGTAETTFNIQTVVSQRLPDFI